ncbi:MAG: glucose-1-phosphate adenylyltransferase subunit GlgD [Clostridiaceae bacterium]|jgi:glucose-1-phosphate adenylyltransferase|nr:glucose-1-phosphate adenylyltransferase subunit GlgD [Clostridiaceae bacterium]
MLDYMGIINLNEREDNIKGLTYHRPLAAVPIAGRYRMIDFALSNLVNAGVQNISIFTQNKYRSLLDHLGTGKAWDLDRKNDGLFIMNPTFDYHYLGMYRGDIENFKSHIDYINFSKQNNVIITPSNMICNLNYGDAVKYHNETGADITIIYKQADNCIDDYQYCNTLTLDENGKIEHIDLNFGKESKCNISMDMYILKKSLFLDIVNSCVSRGYYDYFREAVRKYLDKLKIYGYRFEGYLACINSIYGYYKTNMQLLDMEISKELFFKNGLIYTKVKDEPPTKYEENARVTNSFVANGCVINGQVENSILFRSVKIREGAVVRNSIIMQNCLIEEGSEVINAILDKSVRVTKGKQLIGAEEDPKVYEKKAII